MDDGFLWDRSQQAVQRRVNRLISSLAEWGLSVNSAKTQVLVWGDTRGRTLMVGDSQIEAIPSDSSMTIMGLPLKPGTSPHDLISALLSRARRAFWANRELLQSSAKLRDRLKLLQTTVWQSMSWVIGTIMPTKQVSESLNAFQLQCVVTMTRIKRRPDEYFVDFQARSRRLARYWLHSSGFLRWSTMHPQLVWRYSGHRARNIHQEAPSAASRLTYFRTPQWWAEQQQLSQGFRHRRRHFPRITLEEKCLRAAASGEWREVAQDRERWKQLESVFVDSNDVPWTSGRQLALPSY